MITDVYMCVCVCMCGVCVWGGGGVCVCVHAGGHAIMLVMKKKEQLTTIRQIQHGD